MGTYCYIAVCRHGRLGGVRPSSNGISGLDAGISRGSVGGNSSVGMAKAALEMINGVNLFGKHGAHWSVIFVDIDAHYRNRTTVHSILGRESASKVELSETLSSELLMVVECGGSHGGLLQFLLLLIYLSASIVTVSTCLVIVHCGTETACHIQHLYVLLRVNCLIVQLACCTCQSVSLSVCLSVCQSSYKNLCFVVDFTSSSVLF